MWSTAIYNLGSGIVSAVALIYAYRILSLRPTPLGIVYGLANVGFVGALLAMRVRKWLGLKGTLIATLLISGTATGCMLIAQVGLPYVVLFFSYAVTAVAISIYAISAVSYRQLLVDVLLQGRVTGIMRTFAWGTFPLGSFLGGAMGTLFGIPATIGTGAGLFGVAVLVLTQFQERKMSA